MGLKGLNGSWQVWGNGNAGSKRTASISSAASVQDPAQADGAFRASMGDPTWSSPRAAGTWEPGAGPEWNVDVGSPQKKEAGQIETHSPSHSFSLQQARHRQAAAAHALNGVRVVGLAGAEEDQRANTRFEKEPSTQARFSAGSSPSKPFGGSFNSAPVMSNNGGASQAEHDLTVGLRNISLEDEYSSGQPYRNSTANVSASGAPATAPLVPQIRGPPPMQAAPRPAFNGYAQPADYSAYYNGTPGRDAFADYSQFPYESYRSTPDPSLYGSPALHSAPSSLYPTPQSMHPHELQRSPSAIFYDYANQATAPPSPYYYPSPQAMVFHRPHATHSPMATGPIALGQPPAVADKPRDMPYSMQQQQHISHQNLLLQASMRPPPSPLPPMFGAPLDYSQQLPLVMGSMVPPGTPVYGPAGSQPMHMFHNARGPRRDDGPAALRSALLDEFRANKTRKWELRDIFGYIVEFSGDQHGSRFIQQKLESATSEEKQIVFDEIVPESALQLIQDVFGNYVIQKLFEYGTQVQKTALANTMENHILQLSLQMYGCRVVQKAIEYILPEQQASFVKELEAHVLKIVMDANGNHVIQKLIERVSPERLGFVHAFRGTVYELSTHPFGCRVLQRCFEYLTDDQTRPLLDELHKYTSNLMQDQFGNYVVQFVLEHGKPEDRLLIISRLRGQMLHMAKHKFASNVCEKALITADEENQRLLIDEIMTPRADGFSPVVTMMKDQFANYVLQRALSVATGEQKKQLVALVRSHLTNMKRYSSNYTKHLVAIERLVNS